MKIVLVNVKYSANLGDGVIAECLEHALKQRLPDIQIINCDLAGRTEFGDSSGALRSVALGVLANTPERLKKTVFTKLLEVLVRRKLLPGYRKAIANADIVLFGGGQIFADADLNFPMKIAAAASVARNHDLPIAIHSVGVGKDWSDEGKKLFKEAFVGADIVWASVRDQLSQKRWRRHFNGADIQMPGLSLDPGLLGAKTYGASDKTSKPNRNRPLIGIGVTHPSTLKLHQDSGDDGAIDPDVDFYRACATEINKADYDILLFTNGASDDEQYLHRCFPPSVMKDFDEDQIRIAPPSKTPEDLVKTIRECDGIVSHRLHASIIAYAYRIAHVGLSTNNKLDEFFKMVGRQSFLLAQQEAKPEDVAKAISLACETPISENAHVATLGRVERDIDELANALAQTKPDMVGKLEAIAYDQDDARA